MTNEGAFTEDAADPFDEFCNFDTEGMTPDSLDSGGTVNVPGKYMFMIQDVTCDVPDMDVAMPKTPSVRLDMKVLNANYDNKEMAAMVDRIHFHRIYLAQKEKKKEGNEEVFVKFNPPSEGQTKNIARFARDMGLVSDEQIGGKLKIPPAAWQSLKGRLVHGEIESKEESYNGQPQMRYEIPWSNIKPYDHPECENWPKDNESIAIFKHGQSGGGTVDQSDFDDL